MLFTNSLVQVVCNRQLQLYGGDLYVGVMTVLISVRDVATMVVNGITSGAQPVISFNYGAQKKDRVKQGIRFMVTICIIYTCLMWIMTLTFPEAFIRLFNSDAELVAAAVPSMHLYFFGFCFMALQFTGQASFQALGRGKICDLLFDFPKSYYCGAADDPASDDPGTGTERRLYRRTCFQSGGRLLPAFSPCCMWYGSTN